MRTLLKELQNYFSFFLQLQILLTSFFSFYWISHWQNLLVFSSSIPWHLLELVVIVNNNNTQLSEYCREWHSGKPTKLLFQLLLREHTTHTHSSRDEQKSSENPSGMIRRCFLDSWNAIVYCKFLCPVPIGFDPTAGLTPAAAALPRMPFNHIIRPGCSAVPLSQGPSSHI